MSSTQRGRVQAPTAEQEKQMMAWRAQALEEMPYFSRLIFSLRVLNAPGLGTWAVDFNHRLYVDFDAVMAKGFRWNVESVLHEASHLFADHIKVRGELGIDPADSARLRTLNVANDLSINDDLTEAGCTTFLTDKMVPACVGLPDNETPHFYFAKLRDMQEQRKQSLPQRPEAQPTLVIRPAKIGAGTVAGHTVVAEVTGLPAGTSIDTANASLTATDADGAPVPLNRPVVGSKGAVFSLANEETPGNYTITLDDGTMSLAANLAVVEPSIKIVPDHLTNHDLTAASDKPIRLTVIGQFTDFRPSTAVTMHKIDIGDDGERVKGAVVDVCEIITVSATALTFDIDAAAVGALAPGLYAITVTGEAQDLPAVLPIGLPHMDLDPATLASGFTLPQAITASAEDFTFTASSVTEFVLAGLVAFPGAATLTPKTTSEATLALVTELPDGPYVVTATGLDAQGAPATAYASLHVGGQGDGGESSDADGQDQAGGVQGQDSEPFKGCGSGSGGEAWEGELDPNDDMDGQAPAVGEAEKQSILVATAAAIHDHVAKGRGTVPGGLIQIADRILAPSKTPWQKVLGSTVRRAVARKAGQSDVDRSKRHLRKHNMTVATPRGPRRIVAPAYVRPTPKIELIRDTSGSMNADDIAMVSRECEAIARKIGVRGEDFIVTDVDAQVHASVGFKGRDSIKKVHGRGGTSMTVGILNAWARKDRASVIVVATDGGTDYPSAPGPIPVVVCLVPQDGADTDFLAALVPHWMKVVVAERADRIG